MAGQRDSGHFTMQVGEVGGAVRPCACGHDTADRERKCLSPLHGVISQVVRPYIYIPTRLMGQKFHEIRPFMESLYSPYRTDRTHSRSVHRSGLRACPSHLFPKAAIGQARMDAGTGRDWAHHAYGRRLSLHVRLPVFTQVNSAIQGIERI